MSIYTNNSYVTVLTSLKHTTRKQYNIINGILNKGEVQSDFKFDSNEFNIDNINSLYNIILNASQNPHNFLIRGKAIKGYGENNKLFDVVRRKEIFEEYPTSWICIDFDKVQTPFNRTSKQAIDYCIKSILPVEFHNVSYIYQWSSSAGLEYNNEPIKYGTNVHVFFYLDTPLLEEQFNIWLPAGINDKYYKLVDPATFRTVQPIFINSIPDIHDGIIDTILPEQKIGINYGEYDVVKVPELKIIERSKIIINNDVDVDVEGDILNILEQYIHQKHSNGTWSLKSPQEQTKGGYFVYTNNPYWINHPDKTKSMHVSDWLKEHYGVNYKIRIKEDNVLKLIKKASTKVADIINVTEGDVFGIDECNAPESRETRQKKLESSIKDWFKYNKQTMLLYAFEGYGKSYSVHTLKKLDKKVIFACKSNAQAIEQGENFNKQGLKVQIILSREYKLKINGYGECLVYGEATSPWENGEMIESATINQIIIKKNITKDDAVSVWEQYAPDKPDFENDIVVCTHARLRVWGFMQTTRIDSEFIFNGEPIKSVRTLCSAKQFIPDDVVCIWDDCESADFEWYKPFDNKWANVEHDGRVIQTHNVGNKIYFVKPVYLRYGYGLKNKMIFTTTEILTSALITRAFSDYYAPELMPDGKMIAGDISLVKTKMTSATRDGLLLPLSQRIKKEGFNHHFIGDGIGLEFNLSNNKGRNDLNDRDLIIKISQAHPDRVNILLDELGWNSKDIQTIKTILALDPMHQAIGRTGGYRWYDGDTSNSVVVLCDCHLAQNILENTRYQIEYTEDLDDLNYSTFRKRPRGSLVDCVAWYIQNYDSYICGEIGLGRGKGYEKNKIFLNDCNEAISQIDVLRRPICKTRISNAIKKYVGNSKIKAILSKIEL